MTWHSNSIANYMRKCVVAQLDWSLPKNWNQFVCCFHLNATVAFGNGASKLPCREGHLLLLLLFYGVEWRDFAVFWSSRRTNTLKHSLGFPTVCGRSLSTCKTELATSRFDACRDHLRLLRVKCDSVSRHWHKQSYIGNASSSSSLRVLRRPFQLIRRAKSYKLVNCTRLQLAK